MVVNKLIELEDQNKHIVIGNSYWKEANSDQYMFEEDSSQNQQLDNFLDILKYYFF